jgi:hypothetical protein
MDKRDAIALLEHLRNQIYSLEIKQALGEDFSLWHREVLVALSRIFGQDSPEEMEFRRIQFALHPEIRQASREHFSKSLEEYVSIPLPDDFEIPQDHNYLERLAEASGFLLAMIVKLRQGT